MNIRTRINSIGCAILAFLGVATVALFSQSASSEAPTILPTNQVFFVGDPVELTITNYPPHPPPPPEGETYPPKSETCCSNNTSVGWTRIWPNTNIWSGAIASNVNNRAWLNTETVGAKTVAGQAKYVWWCNPESKPWSKDATPSLDAENIVMKVDHLDIYTNNTVQITAAPTNYVSWSSNGNVVVKAIVDPANTPTNRFPSAWSFVGGSDSNIVTRFTPHSQLGPTTFIATAGKSAATNVVIKLKVELKVDGISDEDAHGTGGLMPVNLHFDEQNKVQGTEVLAPDNEGTARITVGDKELRKVTLSIAGGNTKGKWKLQFDESKIKFWKPDANKPGGYALVNSNQESAEVALPYGLDLLAEGIGADTASKIKLAFSPSGSNAICEDNITLKLFEYWIQDVTRGPENPCGVGKNKQAVFKLTRLTETIVPPNEVEWQISAGGSNAQIVGSNKGRAVTVQGAKEGPITLKATWKNFTETIDAQVVGEQKVDLSIVIVCTDNQNGHDPYWSKKSGKNWTVGTTQERVAAFIARANQVFTQWNMEYKVKSINYLVFQSFHYYDLKWGRPDLAEVNRIMTTYEADGNHKTVEMYFFEKFEGVYQSENYNGVSYPSGIGVNAGDCTDETPAHECDHTMRKNGAPLHQLNYYECLMYPFGIQNRWDIPLSEALGFTNFHSDW